MSCQGHRMKQSHRSTACRLVYRGYTEDMKTIFFFLLVQTTFHSYQSPPGQQVQEKKPKQQTTQKTKKENKAANQHRTVILGNHTESWSS